MKEGVKLNWKILMLFIGAFATSINVLWQTTISNKMITMELFWTFFSVILFAYISAASVLVFKYSQVNFEKIIVKLSEENIRIMDVAEVCIELAAAKPEKLENIVEMLKKINRWNASNEQLKHLNDLEAKLENIIKEKNKEDK